MIAASDSGLSLPRVTVQGSPFERGRQYGLRTRERIRRSIDNYCKVFTHRAGLDWPAAVNRARSYEKNIGQFAPDCLHEIRGIAEGAAVERDDILAINARSELMFAAAQTSTGRAAVAGECTSFAILPEASDVGHTIIGQNWDWLPFALDTVVFLEAHRDDGPSFVTIVEAGLLAKTGFNSAGLGVCTNTLLSSLDNGRPGVPYHVLLRTLLDAENMTAAARTLYSAERTFSGNYLIAHADGLAVNAETVPGDSRGVHVAMPDDGVLVHANHFLSPELARLDARVATYPNTFFRLDAMQRALTRGRPAITFKHLTDALRGHQNHSDGVCSHPDGRMHPLEQRATIVSVIADLTLGELWLTPGPPCAHDYERYMYRSALEQSLSAVSVD